MVILIRRMLFQRNENVKVTLKILCDNEKAKNFLFVNCFKVINVKMEIFRGKACLMVGGHRTQMLDVSIYSMITREMVHIALMMIALHDLEVKEVDVLHVNVMVSHRETTSLEMMLVSVP